MKQLVFSLLRTMRRHDVDVILLEPSVTPWSRTSALRKSCKTQAFPLQVAAALACRRADARILDLVSIELTPGLQVSERASVRRGVTGANFQRPCVSEHETHNVMMGDWRFSNADEGDRHDRAIIYGVDEIADSELRECAKLRMRSA